MRTLLALPFLLGLLACATPPDDDHATGVTLAVEPVPATPGDSVDVVLGNHLDGPVGYNLCASGLQRRSGGDWTEVPSDRVCTMELRTLPPGEEARFRFALPVDLPAGEYRPVTWIEVLDTDERRQVAGATFTVE